ncbi:MAG: hypothetical protein HYY24_05435 [Verrucomicrobia bacterium]|nr:hypothetical protein [Verrucomicrobiota bacterium]
MPTRYNDGTPVEPEKFLLTRREIGARFGALTFFPQPVHGEWTHEGVPYVDVNLRLDVVVEDTPDNAAFFLQLKQTLKERFRQIDIWIVSSEVRIT